MADDLSQFVRKTVSLLNLERRAEIEEARSLQENISPKELQKRGVCLLKLRIRGRRTGLYGRCLITFELNKPGSDGKLPSHSFTAGDIVGLGCLNEGSKDVASGIVSRVIETAVTVAFDEAADSLTFDDDGPFKLVKLANDVTHKRIKSALDALTKHREGPAAHLIDVLFGSLSPGPSLQICPFTEEGESSCLFFNPDLNESQKQAVKFALCQREVALVHGPPGTGKTTTVVEIIIQAVRKLNMKVLACAPSNVAVDNLVEKLVKCKVKVVRLGHPARLLGVVQEYSLDALLSNSEGTAIVRDVRRDIDGTLIKVRKARDASEKKHLKQEIKALREELRQREDKAITEILTKADVVLATNTSASADGPLKLVKPEHFDLVVIDEVAQALEAGCWIPLLRAPRCVLAGDHLQLPPTIKSVEAAKQGLQVTLMERLTKLLGDAAVRMLTTQYRMNAAIMNWSSEKLYEGRLQAHSSVESHLLKDLPGVLETDVTSLPLLLIDTAGCDVGEKEVKDEVSKGNEGEADIVAAHVMSLITAGLKPSDIAVIAPYNLQVELLRLRLSSQYPTLEIKSVDGFQGREKEAVVISLVRSNNKGEVGFLAEHRRINVAITRARRHLAVIADSETVSNDEFLKSLTEYMTSEGEVRSAHEYIHDSFPTADAAPYHYEHHEVFIKEKRKDHNKKKKGVEAKKGESKDRVDLNASVGDIADKTKDNEVNFDAVCNFSAEEPNPSSSSHSSDILKESSSSVKSKNNDNFRQLCGSSSFDITVAPRYSRETLEKEISTFAQDESKTELSFPKSLNSQQRYDVHSIAEQLGLNHESRGEGKQRYIVVRKPTPATKGENDEAGPVSTCPFCKKRVPSCNLQLHSLRCEQQLRSSVRQKDRTEDKETFTGRPSSKPAKTDAKTKPQPAKQQQREEDFDKLLASFTMLDTHCAYETCTKNIRTLGQTCKCCVRIFCLSHHIPEVHGCGIAAKIRARQLSVQTKSAETKPLGDTRKAQLHRKLDRKLDEMSDLRRGKKKGGDGKK